MAPKLPLKKAWYKGFHSSMNMNPHRLFVGLELSPVLTKRLAREVVSWENPSLRLVSPKNWHVTLLFLGQRSEEDLAPLLETLERITADVSAFEIRFDRLALVPDEGAPKYLSLSGEASEELRLLRQTLERGLGYLTPERKSFQPHVTLGAVKRGRGQAREEKWPPTKRVNLVEPIDRVILFESVMTERGRTYEALGVFPLLS